MMQYLRIPHERIAVLIGEKGSVKAEIEAQTKTKITIEDTAVSVESTDSDSMKEIMAKDMVLAIGRGFNPDVARRLLAEDNVLEIIYLKDHAHTPNGFRRLKGRIIGEKGKSRKVLQNLSNASICVYGKTVAIIGSYEEVDDARQAIMMLIDGARHAAVYKFLEKRRADQKSMPFY